MQRARLVGQLKSAFELGADVVGVQHGVLGGLAQAVRPVGQDVRQRADEQPEVPVPRAHAPDRLRTVKVQPEHSIRVRLHHRRRQKRLQYLLTRHRPTARAAAAMRRREGLVQVQVHHIHAEVSRPRLADQSIHIRAVHV